MRNLESPDEITVRWWDDLQWKEWDVVVEPDVGAAAALASLNGATGAAPADLAFPVFHVMDDRIFAVGQPRGNAHALARDLRLLTSLSAARPTWRFVVSSMGDVVFSMVGGTVASGPEWTDARLRRFLDDERAASAQPRAGEGRLEIHLALPAEAPFGDQEREHLSAQLNGLARATITQDDGHSVPLMTRIELVIDSQRLAFTATPAAGTGGRSVHGIVSSVAEALFSVIQTEADIRVRLAGAQVGRAASPIELYSLARMLGGRT